MNRQDVLRIVEDARERGETPDLSYADLRSSNLSGVNLSGANLRFADLRYADLSDANLRYANLNNTDLRYTDLHYADLSGATGLVSTSEWMRKNLESDERGYIVYRSEKGRFDNPDHWLFAPGAVLTETVNPDPCTECGCGIAAATLDWVREHYKNVVIWRCRIEWCDLADVIVPFNTNGKIRCGRLVLIEKVEE